MKNQKLIQLTCCIFVILFILCSCNITSIIETNVTTDLSQLNTNTMSTDQTLIETTIETLDQTSSSTQVTPSTEIHQVHSDVGKNSKDVIETDTRIFRTSQMTYYNKLDGEDYYLCFDPLCSHTKGLANRNKNCPVCAFSGSHSATFSKSLEKLFIARGDCIFSMNFDASDITVEVEFSEYGKDFDSSIYSNDLCINLSCIDNYIYFVKEGLENEKDRQITSLEKRYRNLYRYDINKHTIENLSKDTIVENLVIEYLIGNNGNILICSGSLGTYYTDMNLTSFEILDFTIPLSLGYFDGENLTSIVYSNYTYNEDKETYLPKSNFIVDFNMFTKEMSVIGEPKDIDENKDGSYIIYGLKNGYILYSIHDSFLIGSHIVPKTNKESFLYNSYHTLYSIKTDGTDRKIIFEGLKSDDPTIESYHIFSLLILGEKIRMSYIRLQKIGSNYDKWQTSASKYYHLSDEGELIPID